MVEKETMVEEPKTELEEDYLPPFEKLELALKALDLTDEERETYEISLEYAKKIHDGKIAGGTLATKELQKKYGDKKALKIMYGVKRIFAQAMENSQYANRCLDCAYKEELSKGNIRCTSKIAFAKIDQGVIKPGEYNWPMKFNPEHLRYCDGYKYKRQRRGK